MDLVLAPPAACAATATGLIFDVAAVAIQDPTGIGDPYVRLTDGTAYRIPDLLRDWAMLLIAAHQRQRNRGDWSIFPCQIEFGIADGQIYAELM